MNQVVLYALLPTLKTSTGTIVIKTKRCLKVDLHSIRFCAFLRVLTQCVRRSVFLIRFLIYAVSVNAFFANARQNAPSILVRFRVEPSSTFATNYVRQLRNWMAGLAVLHLGKLCWAVDSVFSST